MSKISNGAKRTPHRLFPVVRFDGYSKRHFRRAAKKLGIKYE